MRFPAIFDKIQIKYNMQPLVSIIITTRNEESVIADLLESVKKQTYKKCEIIVVDNASSDATVQIAKKYTRYVFTKGPERSAQRNFGAKKSKGAYLLFLDADMTLDRDVVSSCVIEIQKRNVGGIIIPEQSFGEGFWAQAKSFERTFYVGDDSIEAARFYDRKIFDTVDGFDEHINGPEDWDLSDRVRKEYGISRISDYIHHNEGRLSLVGLMKKKYYYGLRTHEYMKKNAVSPMSSKVFFFLRPSYYKKPKALVSRPLMSGMMFIMLTGEFFAGTAGFLVGKFKHS